jgi:hypothetical protein
MAGRFKNGRKLAPAKHYRMSKPDEQEAMSSAADGARAVPAPHVNELRTGAASVRLSDLHGQTVAVQVPVAGEDQFLKGRAAYGSDPELGMILRISVVDSPGLEIVIAESLFNGQIMLGDLHACDYLLRVGASSAAETSAKRGARP